MEVPRGFTRCDECEGKGDKRCDAASHQWFGGDDIHHKPCPFCSGSGLVPTEKLREDVAMSDGLEPQPKKRSPMVNDLGGSERSLSNDERTAVLFALARREGYELYRPEQAIWATVTDHKETLKDTTFWEIATKGAGDEGELVVYEQYRLVPISQDDDGDTA